MSASYKYKRLIARRYRILALILIVLSGGLVLLPKYQKNEGIKPETFLLNAMSTERYLSTDKLAERLINQDPTVLLIDVRTKKEFDHFALPNAVNIPLADLLKLKYDGYINQDTFDVIFYSNDTYFANQAWLTCNRLGCKNLYVLKGGLNKWFDTIINPKTPKVTASEKAFDLYNFRKSAAMYFGVGNLSKTATPVGSKKIILKKKKKKVTEGGC